MADIGITAWIYCTKCKINVGYHGKDEDDAVRRLLEGKCDKGGHHEPKDNMVGFRKGMVVTADDPRAEDNFIVF